MYDEVTEHFTREELGQRPLSLHGGMSDAALDAELAKREREAVEEVV